MPRIIAERGPDRGSAWSIREEGVLLIGRDSGAQIALRDEETSRRHWQLEFRSGQWLIRDLESTNGVIVNGEETPYFDHVKWAGLIIFVDLPSTVVPVGRDKDGLQG